MKETEIERIKKTLEDHHYAERGRYLKPVLGMILVNGHEVRKGKGGWKFNF